MLATGYARGTACHEGRWAGIIFLPVAETGEAQGYGH